MVGLKNLILKPFRLLYNFLSGEDIEVTIVRTDNTIPGGWCMEHTVVKHERKVYYVHGYLGESGDIIVVNTWDLRKF